MQAAAGAWATVGHGSRPRWRHEDPYLGPAVARLARAVVALQLGHRGGECRSVTAPNSTLAYSQERQEVPFLAFRVVLRAGG